MVYGYNREKLQVNHFWELKLSLRKTKATFFLILMAVEDWKEKENCIKRAVNCQKQGEGWEWGSEDYTYPRSLLFRESPFAQQQSS